MPDELSEFDMQIKHMKWNLPHFSYTGCATAIKAGQLLGHSRLIFIQVFQHRTYTVDISHRMTPRIESQVGRNRKANNKTDAPIVEDLNDKNKDLVKITNIPIKDDIWCPNIQTIFTALISVRLCAAVWNNINDCDMRPLTTGNQCTTCYMVQDFKLGSTHQFMRCDPTPIF